MLTLEQMFPRTMETLRKAFKEMGYHPIKRLDTGELAGVMDYVFTAGIVVGLDPVGWRTRYCYESRPIAEAALEAWDGHGDPPGPWIKQKPEDRHGPWYDEKERPQSPQKTRA